MPLDSTQDPPGSFLSSFSKGGTRAKCFCGVHRHRSFTSIFYDANFSFPVFAREGKLWLKTEMKLMTALTVMIRSSAWGAYFRPGYFFLSWETVECAEQSFYFYLKRIERTGKRTCCPWIILSKNDQPNNHHHKILRSLVWWTVHSHKKKNSCKTET